MCLAVAGKLVELSGDRGVVDIEGNRVEAMTTLASEAKVGDYVLVHAGFAIAVITPEDYQIQHRIFEEIDQYARNALETG
jgi:hydrogenase expression/formation protein HypC